MATMEHIISIKTRYDGEAANRGLAGTEKAAQATAQKMQELGRSVSQAFTNIGGNLTRLVTLPILGMGIAAVKVSADFQLSMNTVQAVSEATAEDLQRLRDLAIDMGSKTQFSAIQAADAMTQLARAGFTVAQIYQMLPTVSRVAGAEQLDLAQAADIATNVLFGYRLSIDQFAPAMDTMVAAANATNTSVTELAAAMKYAGALSSLAGVDFNEAVASLSLMSNAGIEASMAGTSLRGVFNALLNATPQEAKALADLGVSAKDAGGNLRPLVDIVRDLQTSSATAGDFLEIFGQRAGPGMASLVGIGADKLADLTAALDDAGGTAQRIADVQLQGFNGQLNKLKASFQNLLIAIGDTGLLDSMTGFVGSITEMVRALAAMPPAAQKVAMAFGTILASIGPIMMGLGQLGFSIVGINVAMTKLAGFELGAKLAAAFPALNAFKINVLGVIEALNGWATPTEVARQLIAHFDVFLNKNILSITKFNFITILATEAIINWQQSLTTIGSIVRVVIDVLNSLWSIIESIWSVVTDIDRAILSVFGIKLAEIGTLTQVLSDAFVVLAGSIELTARFIDVLIQELNYGIVWLGEWGQETDRLKEAEDQLIDSKYRLMTAMSQYEYRLATGKSLIDDNADANINLGDSAEVAASGVSDANAALGAIDTSSAVSELDRLSTAFLNLSTASQMRLAGIGSSLGIGGFMGPPSPEAQAALSQGYNEAEILDLFMTEAQKLDAENLRNMFGFNVTTGGGGGGGGGGVTAETADEFAAIHELKRQADLAALKAEEDMTRQRQEELMVISEMLKKYDDLAAAEEARNAMLDKLTHRANRDADLIQMTGNSLGKDRLKGKDLVMAMGFTNLDEFNNRKLPEKLASTFDKFIDDLASTLSEAIAKWGWTGQKPDLMGMAQGLIAPAATAWGGNLLSFLGAGTEMAGMFAGPVGGIISGAAGWLANEIFNQDKPMEIKQPLQVHIDDDQFRLMNFFNFKGMNPFTFASSFRSAFEDGLY